MFGVRYFIGQGDIGVMQDKRVGYTVSAEGIDYTVFYLYMLQLGESSDAVITIMYRV